MFKHSVRDRAIRIVARRFAGIDRTYITTEDVKHAILDANAFDDPKVNTYLDRIASGSKAGFTRLQNDVTFYVQGIYKIEVIESDEPVYVIV
jgi:hypothetical protein